ncbi:hypothetical protein ABIE26_003224 [Pedobacter africanus]|uniref:Uncharacterized protein n=1 Tax=Pedobacter africanus TaxID=151894 RepID=A0ACC6KZ94_9SPHI|nr:hypothetical protein [Pedobacter africanus]
MKKLKLSLVGIVCLFILAGIVAFKPVTSKPDTSSKNKSTAGFYQWFMFDPLVTSTFSNAINPMYYRPMNIGELCSGNQRLCAIYAQTDFSNPSRPIITISEPIYMRLSEYYAYGITSINIKLKNHF